jgi:hypothetical protein
LDPIEDNRLTNASEADEDHAPGMEPIAEAVEGDGGVIDNRSPPGELRRRGACAGSKRVDAGIHI